jgi:outer membrane autotransporter protein
VTGTVASIGNAATAVITSGGIDDGNAILIDPTGTVGSIVNLGTIQGTGPAATGINVGGTVSTIDNSGLIQGTTFGANAISVTGSVSSITNESTGTMQSSGAGGNAIQIVGEAGTIVNDGTLQVSGAIGAGITVTGTAGTIDNRDLILASGPLGAGIGVAGTVGTLDNSGTVLSNGAFGNAVSVTGTINLLDNSGTIQSSGAFGNDITVTGTITTINNTGLIQATQGNGSAIDLGSGSIGSIINNGGTIESTNSGNAILVAGTSSAIVTIGTIANSGLIQSAGKYAAIEVGLAGSIGSIANNAGGSILATAAYANAIDITGSVGTISNGGLVQAIDFGIPINVEPGGSVGSIINTTGTIQAINAGNAILVGGVSGAASIVGSIANSSTIQASGNAVEIDATGTIASIVNTAGGTIQTSGANANAIDVAGSVTTIGNSGLIQASAGGTAIDVEPGGSIGSISNIGGTVQTANSGNAILVGSSSGGAARIGTIANSGLIQSSGPYAAIEVDQTGTIASVVNNAGGTIQITGGSTEVIDVAGTVGAITNGGLLQMNETGYGGSFGAINVDRGGSVGTISNTGTIQTTSPYFSYSIIASINVAGTVNAIDNSGLILSSQLSGAGINVLGSVGSITNAPGGTIDASGAAYGAINVIGAVGTIANAAGATMESSINNALSVSGQVGSIINAGTLLSSGALASTVNVTGSLAMLENSGLIQTDAASAAAVEVGTAGTIGNILNDAGGIIQATGTNDAAILIGFSSGNIINSAGGTIQAAAGGNAISIAGTLGLFITLGTIANSGLIQSAADPAIKINGTATIQSITNTATGSIQATGAGGTAIFNSGTIGSIVNSGTIIAQQGTALAMGATGQVTGGITNTASGLIQGGPGNGSGVAIDNASGTRGLTIDTAGTIIGQIKLGPAGDTLTVTGGSIVGAVIGQLGSDDTVNFNLTGSFATAGSIANVDTINANAGTLLLQNPVSPVFAFNVASGATVALNANVNAAGFNNAGLVSIGADNPAIAGSYTQASSGTLGVTVTDTAAGKLTVIGNASVTGGPDTVSVHVPITTDPFGLVGQSEHVLTSATLTVANPGLLTASSDNAGIGFSLTNTTTDLVLTGRAQTANQALYAATTDVNLVFAPVIALATPNDIAVQHFLTQVLAGLSLSGQAPLAHSIDTLLNTLSPGALVQLEKQLAPSTLFTASLNLAAAEDVLSSGMGAISDRLTAARLDPRQTGLTAGDEAGRGMTAWGQPFGALTSQDAENGVDGYSVGTYGVTLGGDMLVLDNLRLGVALTLANSDITFSGYTSGSNGAIFSSQFALYGAWYLQSFFVDGALSAGYNQYKRHDVVSAFDIALDSTSGGTQLGARLGAGYDWKLNGAVVTPYASVQQMHFNFDSYTTSGGSAYGMDMHVDGQSADLTQTRLGGRLAYPAKLPDGGTLIPEIHAYYLHDFGSNQLAEGYTTADVAGPDTFAFNGPPVDRDIVNVGVGVTFLKTAAWSIAGGYDYAGGASFNQHNFFVRAKLDF